MLFNSTPFFIFLPIVFTLFWLLKNHLKWQNLLILVSSYIFYGWWDWRFLVLIIISTVNDFILGNAIFKSNDPRRKKLYLILSIISNLGILGWFKYCDFFIENAVHLIESLGLNANISTLEIAIPVGISFYTFQTMSYTIDIYRGKMKSEKDIISFGAFVAFFPQLVAGPIERATNLLPQFYRKKSFDVRQAFDGLKQALWGFFKKIVIADHCAIYVDKIFGTPDFPIDYSSLPGGVLALGSVYFAFQIYADFSGYSDIAIGTAKLFGFDLMRNFNFPYFSRDIAEFWRRWHISLSTWFRDYLYIPLGGSRGNKWNQLRNVMIIFVVSGFWHGANWTFIAWGALNALYFLPLLFFNLNRRNTDNHISDSILPRFKVILAIFLTFSLTCLAWIFFRSASIYQAFEYISEIFKPNFLPSNLYYLHPLLITQLLFFVALEWWNRNNIHPFEFKRKCHKSIRWGIYYVFITVILFSANYHESSDFIYFQF
jgi:alginate O-acetyltransferase complex protein AlgI